MVQFGPLRETSLSSCASHFFQIHEVFLWLLTDKRKETAFRAIPCEAVLVMKRGLGARLILRGSVDWLLVLTLLLFLPYPGQAAASNIGSATKRQWRKSACGILPRLQWMSAVSPKTSPVVRLGRAHVGNVVIDCILIFFIYWKKDILPGLRNNLHVCWAYCVRIFRKKSEEELLSLYLCRLLRGGSIKWRICIFVKEQPAPFELIKCFYGLSLKKKKGTFAQIVQTTTNTTTNTVWCLALRLERLKHPQFAVLLCLDNQFCPYMRHCVNWFCYAPNVLHTFTKLTVDNCQILNQ